MFTVEYFNKAVFITAHNIRRINYSYYTKLRQLIIMAFKQPCNRIVLNLLGVRMIDRTALEMLKLMQGISANTGIQLQIVNIDEDLKQYITEYSQELLTCLYTETAYQD